MLFYLFCVAIFFIAIHVLFNYNAKARLIFKLPSTKSTFIIGHALDVMVSQVELFRYARNMAAKFSGIYGFHAFPVSSVCIYNPEDVEIITSSMKHNEKSNLYKFLKPWLQDGLLVSKGSKWQQRRKILTSAFHFNVLQKYFVTIKDNDKALIEALKKSNGEPVDIVPTMSEYTLNTICESAMGIKLREEESDLGKSYKNAIYSLGKDLVKRFSNIFIHPDITFYSTILGIRQTKYLNTIHSFTKSIIQKRKDALNNCKVSDVNNNEELGIKKRRTAMLDLLLSVQKHGLIDDKGIQEEVDTFMFEGHDTTAAGLTYAILLLANHSDIQNKIVEELHGIFGNDDRDATMDDLAAMKYLELCLKESMRLYPPVPFIMRQITQPCKLSNFEIPNNTLCSIHIYDLHRNEKMFPDPHKFDPERFLPENSVGRHNYAYIPFSAGPRNCIGQKFAMMEMKSSVSSILRNFELVPVTKPSDIVFIADIVLRNTEPVYVRFVPRCLDVKQRKSF